VTYVSLYRRFRPQTFTEVVGQDHVTRTLRNAIAAGRTSHAYLFCGPRGTGKTTVAKVLAKALNCEGGPTPDPCGRCEACIRIQEGRSMDVIEIDAASNRGIDEIRDLRERVKFAPVEERYKVYIIDEVHMLTQEAFNALLKTLEEPPQRVVFILATTEPHRVLATILSRCQRFDFRRLTISELSGQVSRVAEAEGIQLDKDAVRLIATGAQGAARDALGLLEQCAAYTGGKITYEHAVAALGVAGFRKVVEFCDAVIQGDLAGALTLVRELIDSGHDPAMFLRDVLEHFRNLLVLQACGFKPDLIDVPETSAANLKRQAEVIPGALILEAIDILSDAESEMKYSASPQLTSEVITIKLVYLSSPLARDSQTTTSQERLTAGPAKGSQATADPATGSQATADPAASAPSADHPRAGGPTAGGQATADPAKGGSAPGRPPTADPAASAPSADYSRAGGPRAVGPTAGVPAKTSTQASLDQIQADWNRVMDALKPGIEKTLYCEDGIPVELNENELVISFHDDVRKELASEQRRKKSIQDALEKVFGVRFAISFVLTQEPNNVEFHLEPGDDSFKEEKISSADRPLDTEYSQEITGDIKDENESCLENHEEELAENLRRTREAVREHPTVKTALSVFKGRVFKIDV
jgi:DNA polymerase-3 subunit gamma/tau